MGPQYDDRLFIELQVQYMKIPSSNLGRKRFVQKLFLTHSEQFLYSTCSPHVLQKGELLMDPNNKSYTHFGQLCQRCKKSYTPLCIEKNIPGLHYIGVKLVKSRKNAYAHVQHWIYYRSYLNYYLSFDVCACFHLSFCKKKKIRPKWIKFANSVNRHLE